MMMSCINKPNDVSALGQVPYPMKLIANLTHVDRQAALQYGLPSAVLMERAGQQVAQAVQCHAQAGQKGVIVCGPGNNGGDGLVCARQLYEAGFHNLVVIYTGQSYRNEVLAHFEHVLTALPIPVVNARQQGSVAQSHLAQADFIVDALFGSGLSRPVQGVEAELIEGINQRRAAYAAVWVLAVDLPSGVDSATGQCWGPAVQADFTVTLAVGKPGLWLQPGKALADQVQVADIGLPAELIAEEPALFQLITTDMARCWLPPRLANSHKYQYGHVLVIAGSQKMPGAAVLSSEAAMSAGAGLVTLAVAGEVFSQVSLMPEIMRLPLPGKALSLAAVPLLQQALQEGRYHAVLLGPGLGRLPETQSAVCELLRLLKNLQLPVVVDADALYALASRLTEPGCQGLGPQFILTPHVGECARLLQMEASAVATDLRTAAIRLHEQSQAQVVLKSASTLVVGSVEGLCTETAPECWLTPTGNPGMATAGSGDVLAGIISAMAAQCQAQNRSVAMAAPLGVYLHGLAGDAAAQQQTPYAMRASDITRHLPHAFKRVSV